jgi:DNA-binding transcriptional LysR family regulator
MIINSELYQIFYYVAQNKSLTAAANQLYLSQSTVSRAIQSLENKS